MKGFIMAIVLAITATLSLPASAFAIDPPDSTPSIDTAHYWAWRNVLETGDQFYLILENTPYTAAPTDYTYSEAFLWRFFDGATEEAQSLAYDYNNSGYGYNVVGFYFAAADVPGAWAGDYTLRLSGNPAAFADPPEYNYDIPASAYSALTDTDDVKADIADVVIYIADRLYTYWSLTSTTTLTQETETATVLSLQGQVFFRGAVYGLQGMAPAAFPLTISDYDVTDRTWTTTYQTDLEAQHAGTPIETAFNAGESLFDVDYNLLGLLIAIGLFVGIIITNWMLAGGNLWKGIVEGVPVLVIGTRMGMVGMGELALVAALCMLYDNARLWKLI